MNFVARALAKVVSPLSPVLKCNSYSLPSDVWEACKFCFFGWLMKWNVCLSKTNPDVYTTTYWLLQDYLTSLDWVLNSYLLMKRFELYSCLIEVCSLNKLHKNDPIQYFSCPMQTKGSKEHHYNLDLIHLNLVMKQVRDK